MVCICNNWSIHLLFCLFSCCKPILSENRCLVVLYIALRVFNNAMSQSWEFVSQCMILLYFNDYRTLSKITQIRNEIENHWPNSDKEIVFISVILICFELFSYRELTFNLNLYCIFSKFWHCCIFFKIVFI